MSVEMLANELANLPPGELDLVMEMLEKLLLAKKQLDLAGKIIEKYRPALLELAR